MDWGTVTNRFTEYGKKYRYVLLVVLIGIFLMTLPEEETVKEKADGDLQTVQPETSFEDALAEILSKIDGAGKVDVLLSQAEGEQILYQIDEDISTNDSSSDIRKETVLVTGTDRAQTGLIRQINPPVYLGAIILCQGADQAGIRLAIVEAVTEVTGLSSDKITVLKMK